MYLYSLQFIVIELLLFFQGFPGRDGIPGSNGLPGPPGHVFVIPVSITLCISKFCFIEERSELPKLHFEKGMKCYSYLFEVIKLILVVYNSYKTNQQLKSILEKRVQVIVHVSDLLCLTLFAVDEL